MLGTSDKKTPRKLDNAPRAGRLRSQTGQISGAWVHILYDPMCHATRPVENINMRRHDNDNDNDNDNPDFGCRPSYVVYAYSTGAGHADVCFLFFSFLFFPLIVHCIVYCIVGFVGRCVSYRIVSQVCMWSTCVPPSPGSRFKAKSSYCIDFSTRVPIQTVPYEGEQHGNGL